MFGGGGEGWVGLVGLDLVGGLCEYGIGLGLGLGLGLGIGCVHKEKLVYESIMAMEWPFPDSHCQSMTSPWPWDLKDGI